MVERDRRDVTREAPVGSVEDSGLRTLVERPFGLVEMGGDESLAVLGEILGRVAAEDADPRVTWIGEPREECDVECPLREDPTEDVGGGENTGTTSKPAARSCACIRGSACARGGIPAVVTKRNVSRSPSQEKIPSAPLRQPACSSRRRASAGR
jgi:hypothetical protein